MLIRKTVIEEKRFLNPALLEEFREVINSSNIFYDVPKYKHLWNLICVLMDRLESAVNYLNSHINQPKTEEDFVFFLVYASVLKDGIYKMYENIYKAKPKTINNKKWFKDAHDYSKPVFNEINCPTDDVFFEYLRALAFAHPFETSRRGRPFMKENEVHCSPWVISHCVFNKEKDSVGIRVYSNDEDDLTDLFISFGKLKKYLLERYSLIKTFIKWGKDEIIKQNVKWMRTKVNRSGNSITILRNACEVLDERFEEHYSIDEAIKILESSFDEEQNKNAVEHIKERIEKVIDSLCDCIDNLDYEGMEKCMDFLYERPNNLHNNANYELEKTFNYLEDERGLCLPGSNEEWGLFQATIFYKAYAHKYVKIDFNKMTYLQIKILIRVALITGREKENNRK